MYESQKPKKTNQSLNEIKEDDSYIDGSETYNNSTIGYNNSTIGYNNSSTGYNNTQPSMGYSNDNEDIETGRGGRRAGYLPHNWSKFKLFSEPEVLK